MISLLVEIKDQIYFWKKISFSSQSAKGIITERGSENTVRDRKADDT